MTRDLPRHANPCILIFRLRRSELRAITAPDQDRENFFRIRLVEVQESRLTLALRGEVRARHFAADGSGFADVIFGLRRGDLIDLCLFEIRIYLGKIDVISRNNIDCKKVGQGYLFCGQL
jgi:hypothetical protein